jgi:hypothetical protein
MQLDSAVRPPARLHAQLFLRSEKAACPLLHPHIPRHRSGRLVLRSLNAVIKETTEVATHLGRSTPDPQLGLMIELSRRDASGLLNLIGGGLALSSQGIMAEETPPASCRLSQHAKVGNEDLMEPGMHSQPGAGLGTVMAGEVVGDDEDVARRIVSFNVSEQGNVRTIPERGKLVDC